MKLNEYALLAASFLCLKYDLQGQVIYTDIEPDILLDEYEEVGFVDMDNNGDLDFGFENGFSSFTVSTSLDVDYIKRNVQWVGWYGTSANEIAGYSNIGPFGSFTRYYPYAFNSGEIIKEGIGGANFQNWGLQRMAFKSYRNDIFWRYGGSWYPEVSDKYLGVKFLHEDGEIHFGWIRCSVIDSCEGMIIKDYAYETIPEKKIIAGDKVGDTTNVSIENQNNLIANIFSDNLTVYINLSEIFPNLIVSIYDITGKLIIIERIEGDNKHIKMKTPGIYIVNLVSEEKKFSAQLLIK